MCSSRGLCGDNNRPNRASSSEGSGSGAHYALCALGVGLIALGIVMIVWTVIPRDGEDIPNSAGNSTGNPTTIDPEEEDKDGKSSTVAMVLVGVGAAMLLLSIFLGVRNKRRRGNASSQAVATAVPLMIHVPGQWVVAFSFCLRFISGGVNKATLYWKYTGFQALKHFYLQYLKPQSYIFINTVIWLS